MRLQQDEVFGEISVFVQAHSEEDVWEGDEVVA